jgi:hypothetical protein
MHYHDGSSAKLGDIVAIPMSTGSSNARVVMLGDTREHLDMDEGFVAWIESEKLLEPTQVVIEWLDQNPLAHSDPQYASVGNYMFTSLCCVTRVDD